MESLQKSFLFAVAGEQGAQALLKAASQSQKINESVIPCTVMSWAKTVGPDFQGAIPGTEIIIKSTGSIPNLIAKTLVGLGISKLETINYFKELDKLIKSIDLLVTCRIEDMKKNEYDRKKKILQPEKKAVPAGPKAPTPPVLEQKASPKRQSLKLPKVNKQPLLVKVYKIQAEKKCDICGNGHFQGDKYTGCSCTKELAKSIKTEVFNGYYLLKLNKDLEEEATFLKKEFCSAL